MEKIKNLRSKSKYGDTGSNPGLLDKITRRYSSVSNKFMRRTPGRRGSPQPISSASYDMTGIESEDHRIEIGAPILISKTYIDDNLSPISNNSPEKLPQTSPNDSLTSEEEFLDANDQSFTQRKETEADDAVSTGMGSYDVNPEQRPSVSPPPPPLPSSPPPSMPPAEQPHVYRAVRSKSAQNLHKSEMQVFLERTPSLEVLNVSRTPKTTPTPSPQPPTLSCSESQRTLNNNDVHYLSKISFRSDDQDFDLKSISFESLHVQNDDVYESLRDINWIREEFDRSINLEYCEHRDNLKPCERRITLLRNKNNRIVNLDGKKEKLSNAWSGLKSWIGEEKGKIKEVVQKHAALQRVGAGNIIKNQAFFDKMKKDEGNGGTSRSDQAGYETTPEREWDSESSRAATISRTASEIGGRDGSEEKTVRQAAKKAVHEGQNGFEELRRYVKQGGDFGKDLVAILHERIEAEQLYCKSLSKMASKLSKACREIPGTVADAWRGVATEMESRGEVHRQFSNSLSEDIVKPLKNILDNQHKTRKAIEGTVDKSARVLSEWRISEAKAKKNSHSAARDNEKLQDAMIDARITRSPSMAFLHHRSENHIKGSEKDLKTTEKDCAKLDNKRKKAEDAVKRADVEYYTICIRSERARVDWEMSVLRGSNVLQTLENQRLSNLKNYVNSYLKLTSDMNPLQDQIIERLNPIVETCNTQRDMTVIKNIRRTAEGPSEQLLPDFYCEHTTLAMNRDRRKASLVKLLQLVRQDLERERRSRHGMKELSHTLTGNDNHNLADKLYHIRSMLTYLEGARYKLQSALLELDHKPRGTHPLAPHIQITRDRTGLQQSILKVPLWLKENEDENDNTTTPTIYNTNSDIADEHILLTNGDVTPTNQSTNDVLLKKFTNGFRRSKSNLEFKVPKIEIPVVDNNGKSNTLSDTSNATDSPIWDRGIADGVSNQPDSDFDEFSSQDEDEIEAPLKEAPAVISRCRAIYSYTPKLFDELELSPGDIIDVHEKQEDGWWLGATKKRHGIFPATYVEEIP